MVKVKNLKSLTDNNSMKNVGMLELWCSFGVDVEANCFVS